MRPSFLSLFCFRKIIFFVSFCSSIRDEKIILFHPVDDVMRRYRLVEAGCVLGTLPKMLYVYYGCVSPNNGIRTVIESLIKEDGLR